jgi:glycosyltransferase involved in cell wall biosynthesis
MLNATLNPRLHDVPAPSGNARVTVVIPCYNYGRYLPACVASVLAQEDVRVDALILNDASTDDTATVAHRLAEADGRVAVINHASNCGHISTFNEGLAAATGDYIVLLSADDMLTRGSLRRATAVLDAHPSVGLVYGHPRVIHTGEMTPARTHERGVLIWDGPQWISAQCRRGLSCIYSPEACVRASVQHSIGGYSPELPHAGDVEMWLRFAAVSDVARVNSDQAYRRVHDASMMQTTFAGLLTDLQQRLEAFEAFFAGAGASLPQAQHDRATVRRRLAGEALEQACVLLRDTAPDPEAVTAFVNFAQHAAGGDQQARWQWREYAALAAADRRRDGLQAARLRFYSARRDLENRYRWCRWRLAGV